MIALAILAVSLVAVAAINAGAINMHSYAKKLTIATLLARGKMADIETELLEKGLPGDDETQDGTFDEEGFPKYQWEAQIIRPKTEKVSTDALFSMMGMGSLLSADKGGGALAGMAKSIPGVAAGLQGSGGGLLAGAMQGQLQGMIDQLGKTLREVRVTVLWPDGKRMDKFTVVSHVVSLGPETAQLQSAAPGTPGSLESSVLPPSQIPMLNNALRNLGMGGGLPTLGLPGMPSSVPQDVQNLRVPGVPR